MALTARGQKCLVSDRVIAKTNFKFLFGSPCRKKLSQLLIIFFLRSISSMFKQVANNYEEPIEDETIINPLLISNQQGSGKQHGPLDFF